MHLLPFFFDNVYTCRPSPRPKRMQFNEIDLLMPFVVSPARNRLMHAPTFVYYQPPRSEIRKQDAKSEVAMDKDQFQVNLDVQHFSPEEITVKTSGDNTIIIEAKHEEKQDSHGHISRQFVRKYVLPKEHDINGVQSKLSSDGVLTITAPRIEENKTEARTIPIQHNDIFLGSIEKEKETEDDRKLENEEK